MQGTFEEFERLFDTVSIHQGLQGKPPRRTITVAMERAFDLILKFCEPDLSLEVGAYEASFSRRVALEHPAARVIAFEANPRIYHHFLPEISKTRVDYQQLAISDHIGEVSLNDPEQIGDRVMPVYHSMSSLQRLAVPNSREVPVPVNATTLDAVLDKEYERIVLWIDVEGATRQVLDGAPRVMRSVLACCIESETVLQWQDQLLTLDLISLMDEWGFDLIMRDCQRIGQANLVFVKRDLHTAGAVRDAVSWYKNEIDKIITQHEASG